MGNNIEKDSSQKPPHGKETHTHKHSSPTTDPPSGSEKDNPQGTAKRSKQKEWISKKLDELWMRIPKPSPGAWTAIFTGFLVVFTFLLCLIAYRADQTSRKSQRAYLSYGSLQMGRKFSDPITHKLTAISLFILWGNSGDTPAKNAHMHYTFKPQKDELPTGYGFPDLGDQKNTRFVLGPKAITASGEFIISTAHLLAVQQGQEHLYIWGWVTYYDIFDDRKQRVTEFCNDIINVTGDVTDPNAVITFTPSLCQEHNCYDEECKDNPNPN